MNQTQIADAVDINICPQCHSYPTLWLRHPEGKQCFNCMKVVYHRKPLMRYGKNLREAFHKSGHW